MFDRIRGRIMLDRLPRGKRPVIVLGVLLAAAVCASANGAVEGGKTLHLTAADRALIVDSKGQWPGTACEVSNRGGHGSKTETAVSCFLPRGGGKAGVRANSYTALINAIGVSVWKVVNNKSDTFTRVFFRKHSTRTTSAVSATRSAEPESGDSQGRPPNPRTPTPSWRPARSSPGRPFAGLYARWQQRIPERRCSARSRSTT